MSRQWRATPSAVEWHPRGASARRMSLVAGRPVLHGSRLMTSLGVAGRSGVTIGLGADDAAKLSAAFAGGPVPRRRNRAQLSPTQRHGNRSVERRGTAGGRLQGVYTRFHPGRRLERAAARGPRDSGVCRGCRRTPSRTRAVPPFGGRSGPVRRLTLDILARPGPLAQLGEHQLDKLGVAGSSPARPTTCPR